MKVIGYRQTTFKTEDGKSIDGYNIYCTYPLDRGEGQGAERVYMTLKKLLDCGYNPAVGDEIVVDYNKYGKPVSIKPVSIELD